ALELAARIGIDTDANDLIDLELGAFLLRHREVRIELVQVGQRNDLRSRGQILSDLDLAYAEFAVERRAHQLLRDNGFGLGDAGIAVVDRDLRGIDGLLRPELTQSQLLGAIELELLRRRLRLEVGEVA